MKESRLIVFVVTTGEMRSESLRNWLDKTNYSFEMVRALSIQVLEKDYTRSKVRERITLGRELLPNEFSAFITHNLARYRGHLSGHDWVLILEDDAVILDGFNDLLHEITQKVSNRASFINLFPSNTNVRDFILISPRESLYGTPTSYLFAGSVGYLLNRKALEVLNNFNGRYPTSTCDYPQVFNLLDKYIFERDHVISHDIDKISTIYPRNVIPKSHLKLLRFFLFVTSSTYWLNRRNYASFVNYLDIEIKQRLMRILGRFI